MVWYYDNDHKNNYRFCPSVPGEENMSCKYTFNMLISDHLEYLGMSTDCEDKKKKLRSPGFIDRYFRGKKDLEVDDEVDNNFEEGDDKFNENISKIIE